MKRWLAVTVGSIALVAFWALPPSVFEMPRPRSTPELVRHQAVSREAARNHDALRILRWADSLSAVVVATESGGVVLSPPTAEAIEPERVAGWLDAQRAALAELPRRDPDMRVGIFWVPWSSSVLDGLPVGSTSQPTTLVGVRDGTPYCVRALPHTDRMAEVQLRSRPELGPCRLYASYGMPGEQMQAWLDASAFGFGRIAVPDHATNFAATAIQPPEPLGRLFGLDRPRVGSENLATQACLAGRADACERAMTEPELIAPNLGDLAWLTAHTPAVSFENVYAHPPFGYLDDALLYEWEARYGGDAFARFWTSSEPVPQAFEAAFGEPLAAWVRDWAAEHVGLYRAGPSLPWSSVWTSLLALAALAVVATVAGVRRRVG